MEPNTLTFQFRVVVVEVFKVLAQDRIQQRSRSRSLTFLFLLVVFTVFTSGQGSTALLDVPSEHFQGFSRTFESAASAASPSPIVPPVAAHGLGRLMTRRGLGSTFMVSSLGCLLNDVVRCHIGGTSTLSIPNGCRHGKADLVGVRGQGLGIPWPLLGCPGSLFFGIWVLHVEYGTPDSSRQCLAFGRLSHNFYFHVDSDPEVCLSFSHAEWRILLSRCFSLQSLGALLALGTLETLLMASLWLTCVMMGVGVSAQALVHVNESQRLVHRRGVFVVLHIPSSLTRV